MENASNKDITFLNSPKYKKQAINTKAAVCVTKKNLENFLPKKCSKNLKLKGLNFDLLSDRKATVLYLKTRKLSH